MHIFSAMRNRAMVLSLVLCPLFIMLFCGQALAEVYTVRPGDSLWKIGKSYGLTADELRQANGLKGSAIYPGQRIYVPEPQTGDTYTVRQGDSLYTIALKYGTDAKKIMADNRLKSTVIYPGQKLWIGGRNSTAVSRGYGAGNITAGDFDILARIITAEADDQSYETKVAVGAVVINRMKSGQFPDTIRSVVYQVDQGGRYQFEPVLNGWINRPANDSARQAARDALNGVDPTNGALYFWESWVRNSFLNSRPVARVMDDFTFTY